MATYAVLRLARGLRASLEDVCVDPDHRGLGIGTKLTSAVIMAAQADGMTNLSLVSPFNPDSVCNPISYRIYRKLGWEQIPGSQYLMRLQLASVNTATLDLSGVEVK
jgi:ribosomal protein S18 acetylase RimI-like enzyme